MNNKDLTLPLPDLVDLADDDFAQCRRILVVDRLALNFLDTLVQVLFRTDHQPAAKAHERNDLDIVLTNFQILSGLLPCFLDADLCHRIDDLIHHLPLKVDFDISLIHVDNNFEFGVRSVLLPDHHPEDVFDDADQDILVDPLLANHLGK